MEDYVSQLVKNTLTAKYSGYASDGFKDVKFMPTYEIYYITKHGDNVYCAVNIKEVKRKKVYNSILGYKNNLKVFEQDIYEPITKDELIDLTNHISTGFSAEKELDR